MPLSAYTVPRQASIPPPIPLSSPVSPASLSIGAFNLLHLGYGTNKNYLRIAKMIISHGFDVFSAEEIMRPMGAELLLQALRQESGVDWQLLLSAEPTGKGGYKEYLGFFYRGDRMQLAEEANQYCEREDLRGLFSHGHSCFIRDEKILQGHDFERDPYVGHFIFKGKALTLVGVHLFFGDTSRKSLTKRQQEARGLHRELIRIQEANPEAEVVALGDFNLQLEDFSFFFRPKTQAFFSFSYTRQLTPPIFPSDVFEGAQAVVGMVKEPTTLGQSNFDHFLVFQSHAARWTEAKTIEDFDLTQPKARELYKKEVSDHLPIQVRLSF